MSTGKIKKSGGITGYSVSPAGFMPERCYGSRFQNAPSPFAETEIERSAGECRRAAVFGVAENGKPLHSAEPQSEPVRFVVHVENEQQTSAVGEAAEQYLNVLAGIVVDVQQFVSRLYSGVEQAFPQFGAECFPPPPS